MIYYIILVHIYNIMYKPVYFYLMKPPLLLYNDMDISSMPGKYAHVVHLIVVLNTVCVILSNVISNRRASINYNYTTTRG